ncbi:MAG: 3-hydroxyacyl-CoA dehydrogenase NAD-binding domain-containing protein [Trueperaceae bacterium]|nr:3-hydroxyacyl-CoA dehydrogenase NAD-binding domain-containing protein [Trueperaceae bacterium]
MSYFRYDKTDGVATLWLEQQGSDVNTLSEAMIDEFAEMLDRVEQQPDVRAAVLISGKPDTFVVGADIRQFVTFDDKDEVRALLRKGQAVLMRLEHLSKPVVAAVHGPAIGGGLEMILACHYRVATDSTDTTFAQAEVKLGLLPGLGGTQRLPRIVGVTTGLELLLTGKNLYAKQARKAGLVDALIHPPGLHHAALAAARDLAHGRRTRRRLTLSWRDRLLAQTPLRRIVYRRAQTDVDERTYGNYPAPYRILDTVRTGLSKGMKAGLDAEADAFADLVLTPESRALVNLFFLQNDAQKNPFGAAQAREVDTVGVLGAGLMGSGIAELSTRGGYDVVLKDQTMELAAEGKGTIWRSLDDSVGKGLRAFERDVLAERVRPVADVDLFGKVDLTIEAVPEKLDLKQQMIRDVEARTPEHHVFASNTSSIPLKQLAEASQRPDRLVGMHYFSPATKVPLLEIIRHADSAESALATACEVGLKQDKTLIVVRDSPGFYTTRILALYMNEGLELLNEGADIRAVDTAMKQFGFPVGPLALFDDVGVDIGAGIYDVLADLFAERGIDTSDAARKMVEAGAKGRKSGRGFYHYEDDDRQGVNDDVYRFFGGGERRTFAKVDVQERLALMMVNEAVRCLEEDVIDTPQDGDVGAVFGLGFPPFLGGPFWYLDTRGAGDVVQRLEQFTQAHGPRLTPATLLTEHADTGRSFYAS